MKKPMLNKHTDKNSIAVHVAFSILFMLHFKHVWAISVFLSQSNSTKILQRCFVNISTMLLYFENKWHFKLKD